MKYQEVKNLLKGLVTEHENNWVSKERESHTIDRLLSLEWLKDGSDMVVKSKLDKKNKVKVAFTKKLKRSYFDYKHTEITSKDMDHDFYVIHEPFGSRSSPDYLFITPNGIFGVEDKSSENHKISWNTGTPGENKIITYFDKTDKKVYLLTSYEYGWTLQDSIDYKEFRKEEIDRGKENFRKRFGNRGEKFEKLSHYNRPMLTDDNLIKELIDPSEYNIDKILKGYLDNIWESQEEQNMGNSIQMKELVN